VTRTEPGLVLSLFPGIGMLDRAFEEEGFCVVRGPDLLWGGDMRAFHPPPGKFDGVIGGPPCQAHSSLNRLNVKRGVPRAQNLVPEFARCVEEAAPCWFLMENVPAAPTPACPSYSVQTFVLNNRELGQEQNRRRRFWFGSQVAGASLLSALIERQPENPVWVPTVCASGVAKPGTEHERGGRWPRLYGWASWANLRKALVWQGFPPEMMDDTPFTLKGAFRMVGNGVPLPMGSDIARAVHRALKGATA